MTRTPAHPVSYLAAAAGFAEGGDGPRAFLERCLDRIAEREPEIGAFAAIALEAARAAADQSEARWRAGRPLSPIDGMPVGIKDVIETADMPTGQGSALFEGHQTGRDAAAVIALREAGAVIVAKTVTTEFAATAPAATRNPHDLSRTPGGSSSGSAAAVADGMLPVALGTQVVGSILRPASYCGVVGFKPSVGALNKGGCNDQLSQSVLGTLSATIADGWAVAREIAARVGGVPGHAGLSGPETIEPVRPRRLMRLEQAGWRETSPEARSVLDAFCEHLRGLGIEIVDRGRDPAVEAVETAIADAFAQTRAILAWENAFPLRTYARTDERRLSDGALARAEEGLRMSLADYRDCLAKREEARRTFVAALAGFDAAIGLAATGAAPVGLESTGSPANAVAGSYLGAPALSLPLLATEGLPLGVQLLGRHEEDAALLSAAAGLCTAARQGHFLPISD